MNIWIFNEYNMLPKHGTLNRHYYLAKHMANAGHNVSVFVGSHPHNTDVQLITEKRAYKVYQTAPFTWILAKTLNYGKSKLKRVFSMFLYCMNVKRAIKNMETPDVIVGSSAHPLAALLAIRLSKRMKCKSVVEIRDLWPESIVEYKILNPNSIILKALYSLEKRMYLKADRIVFLMEGAYDYIIARGWEKEIPKSKVFFVNNGVDIDEFNYNSEHFKICDPDLMDRNKKHIVYVGAIKRVNNLDRLLDVAKATKDDSFNFLIWGDGDELDRLRKRVKDENIGNVIFKGRVEKKYIPFIIKNADVNLVHNNPSSLFIYGISMNKMFDYVAANKPILFDFYSEYNPVIRAGAGVYIDFSADPSEKIVEVLKDRNLLIQLEENMNAVKKEYSYAALAKKYISILE